MSRLPQLRLDKRMQLMRIDVNVRSWTDVPVEQAHVPSGGPRCGDDQARPNALSLAETVELLVRGARLGARHERRQPKSTMLR
jgi:hypothetical protein